MLLVMLFSCTVTGADSTRSGEDDSGSGSPDPGSNVGSGQVDFFGDGNHFWCDWLYAAGSIDDHTLYIATFALPQSDFDAGLDVSYDRALGSGEVALWRDDGASDTSVFYLCNDWEAEIVGRLVPVTSGHLALDAISTGPDSCGSPQSYSGSWTLTDLVTEDGEQPDIGPWTVHGAMDGGCYG